MTFAGMNDSTLSVQELVKMERQHRRALQDVAAARACCMGLRHVADKDEQEILYSLARIKQLLQRLAPQRDAELADY